MQFLMKMEPALTAGGGAFSSEGSFRQHVSGSRSVQVIPIDSFFFKEQTNTEQ
jgi:hypothetical protein